MKTLLFSFLSVSAIGATALGTYYTFSGRNTSKETKDKQKVLNSGETQANQQRTQETTLSSISTTTTANTTLVSTNLERRNNS